MKRKYCERAFARATFYPDGEVWPCPWMHIPLGNVITEEIEDIWNGKNARLARESILDGSFRYCRKESCHFLENDNLPMIDEDEFERLSQIPDMPKELMISYEKTCNHMCPSCRLEMYVPSEDARKGFEITSEKLKKIINTASLFDANGCGEVFASKSIMDVLQYARPENPDFLLTLETNGVLFTPENWDKIAHLKKYRVKVTITPNSFDRDTYKYLSGGHDNLDKLVDNLRFVKSLREVGDINVLKISIVVQDRNFRELPSFSRCCLEEFGADEVTVKPVYQWFGMKEDVYWFKNVRNPMHPYHGEWLEMMKDPILDDPRVFHWGGRHATEAKPHPAYKYKTNQDILLRLMNTDNPGKRLIPISNKLNAQNPRESCGF